MPLKSYGEITLQSRILSQLRRPPDGSATTFQVLLVKTLLEDRAKKKKKRQLFNLIKNKQNFKDVVWKRGERTPTMMWQKSDLPGGGGRGSYLELKTQQTQHRSVVRKGALD